MRNVDCIIGLNMDSIPIIIGAILIYSPSWHPFLGLVFVAILDMNLLRKSFKILFIQVSLSLIASIVYFLISLFLMQVQKLLLELLQQFGGVVMKTFCCRRMAGVEARKKANNVYLEWLLQRLLCLTVCYLVIR